MAEITYQMVLSTIQTAGILMGIVYYIFNMRNQQRTRELTLKAQEQTLETRQSQLFMNIYNQSYANPEFIKAVRKVHTTQWNDYEEWINLYDYHNLSPADPEFVDAFSHVAMFYEGLGVFVKERLIDIRLVALTMTNMTRSTWEKIVPFIEEHRKKTSFPRFLSEFEYLYDELMRYVEEHPELKT